MALSQQALTFGMKRGLVPVGEKQGGEPVLAC